MLRDFVVPDALDMAPQDVARPLYFKRAAPTTGDYLVKFDLLRRKAESRMQMGGAFPGDHVSVLRLQNAPLFRAEKSPVASSAQGGLGIAERARQTRRLYGPMDNSGRRDVLWVTEDGERSKYPWDDEDFGVWAAYRQDKKNLVKEEKRGKQGEQIGKGKWGMGGN